MTYQDILIIIPNTCLIIITVNASPPLLSLSLPILISLMIKRLITGKQTYEEQGPHGQECKTITTEEYKIEMTDPCYYSYTLEECPTLYISIQQPQQQPEPIQSLCEQTFSPNYPHFIINQLIY